MDETLTGHRACERKSQLIFSSEVMTAEGKCSREKLLLKVINRYALGLHSGDIQRQQPWVISCVLGLRVYLGREQVQYFFEVNQSPLHQDKMQIPRLLLKRIDQIPLESQAQGLAFFTMSPEVSWTVKLENQYFCFVLFCFWKRVFQSQSISDSPLGMISPLVLSGDITDCHDCGRVPCIWWPEARDTARHPPVHSTAPPNGE